MEYQLEKLSWLNIVDCPILEIWYILADILDVEIC